MNKEFIAYAGEAFTIEWFFDDRGTSQALEYYKSLSIKKRVGVLRLFKRIGDTGMLKDKTKFNYEGEQIYAFKPQSDRFLCFFFRDKKIIVTNAFRKKEQKLPLKEKEKALDSRKKYEIRAVAGNYYA